MHLFYQYTSICNIKISALIFIPPNTFSPNFFPIINSCFDLEVLTPNQNRSNHFSHWIASYWSRMSRDSFVISFRVFLLPNRTSKFPLNSARQSIFRSAAEVSFRETTRRLRLKTCLNHYECQHFLCRNVVDHWRSFIKENQIPELRFANACRNQLRGYNSLRSRSLCFQTRKTGDIYSEVHSARIDNIRKNLCQRNDGWCEDSFADKPRCLPRLRAELSSEGWRRSGVGVLCETSCILHTAWRVRDGSLHQGPKWQLGGLCKD